MLRKSGYHRPPKKQKNGSKRQAECQLQLPLQLFLPQNQPPKNKWYYCFFKTLALIAIIVATIFISSAYYQQRFSETSPSVVIEVKEFSPVAPQSIEDLIPEDPLPEENAVSSAEQPAPDVAQKELSDQDTYDLYEEKLPEEVHTAPAGNAKPQQIATNPPSQPQITIVIDDMGINIKRTKDISSLKYPITASFLTYADNLGEQIAHSVANGHEIMAHLPMEPQIMQNFTAQMLTTSMSDKKIKQTLREMLDLFPHISAVNNHMGSKFTEDKHRMAIVIKELAKRDLIFLDSKTTSNSAGPELAARFGLKFAERNVFLDNNDDFNYIMGQLRQTEQIARTNGYAIAIGHPKEQTYLALKAWLPTLPEKGLHLVPLSDIVKAINKRTEYSAE